MFMLLLYSHVTEVYIPLMVVIAMFTGVVDSAHIHNDVASLKNALISSSLDFSITVLWQFLQHVTRQHLHEY